MDQNYNNDQNNINNQSINNQNSNQGMGTNSHPVQIQNTTVLEQTPQLMSQQSVIQEPTTQTINSFNGNNSNQNSNNNTSKKAKLGLIIGIIVGIAIVVVLLIFLLSGNTNSSIENTDQSKIITSKDIAGYELENDTIWINHSLGITYYIPKKINQSIANGSSSFSYLHGSSFQYYNGYKIYVDKSLEGHTNLETLASDIISEKNSDKYKNVYNFGSNFLKKFNNQISNKVKIGNYDTIYFESEDFDAKSLYGNELKVKLIGYSFKYNDEYISVYGELLLEEDSQLESLKQMLQFIINSIKPYDGKSLQELNGNAKNYYDDGYTNYFGETNKKFVINYLSSHTRNGVLRNRDTVIILNKEWFTWDGTSDNILNQLSTYRFAKTDIRWFETAHNSDTQNFETFYDILDQKKEHINGIDFYKYTLRVHFNIEKTAGKVLVVYFFVVDNQPYLFQYNLDGSIYNQKTFGEMTSEEQEIIIKQTEEVAYNYLLTFRYLNDSESYSQYVTLFN